MTRMRFVGITLLMILIANHILSYAAAAQNPNKPYGFDRYINFSMWKAVTCGLHVSVIEH